MSGRLISRGSTTGLTHRLERAGAYLLARVPEDVAAYLSRTVIVYAIDTGSHAAFVVAHATAPDAPTRALVVEREAQTGQPRTADPLHIIVIAARSMSLVDILAHECAHVWRGDPLAASPITPDEENEQERATDQLAAEWLARPARDA
jgi:hypothetical protein